MRTVAFYSYKGGVGRTLALACTANYLAENNFSVCILDIDLEAPGIIYKFDDKEPDHSLPGVLDYVCEYIDKKPPESISEYFHTYPITKSSGCIKLMSAGQGLDLTYWKKLASVNWNDLFFGKNNEGFVIFEYLKHQIQEQINPDFLFIDSRSGITALSKMCSMALSDITIILSANNRENRHGTGLMYRQIAASKYNINNNKTAVFCALTRVPFPEDGEPLDRINKSLNDLIQAIGVPDLHPSDITIIYSNRAVENDERSVLRRGPGGKSDEFINGSYYNLINKIVPAHILEAKRKTVFNNPKYKFFEYDIKGQVAKMLDSLRGNLSPEKFCKSMDYKMTNEPITCENLYHLAVCNRYCNDLTGAIANLSYAISMGIGDNILRAKVHYLRGMIFLYDLNNYEDAVNDFKIVYAIDPEHCPSLRYELSVCFLCLELFDEALENIGVHVLKNKEDIKAFVLEANIIFDKLIKNNSIHSSDSKKEINQALTDLSWAIKLDNTYIHTYNSRGTFYYDLGNMNRALADYNKAIELDPNYVIAYNNRGITYDNMGDKDRALADYNKAIEIDPNYVSAYYNRGNTYYNMGEMDRALADYNKAIEFDPNDAIAYYNRGNTYDNMGDKDRALADYNKAIELDPNDAIAYYNRGNTYDNMGDKDRALADYNKAIELDPNYANAYNNRGITYDNMGEMDCALADYNKAIEINPNDAIAYYNRGNTYDNMGDKDRALADYNKAIELDPNYANAYFNRGLLYSKLGEEEKAVTDRKRYENLC